ncbi:2-oxoacid ferredoxin oxidoreductase [bacterium]|nr:2-oxoacid ferredoxin oxidoreductase [bacterium]
MDQNRYDMKDIDIAWCPGCGNFVIWKILKKTLDELNIEPRDVVIVSGIGQAAKMPHYLRCHTFNGLHGRALPPATGIKAVNPGLTVIVESGDGDMYGEGGNHFMHTIRRNPDITNIVHNNMIYGLTKGQASPTSQVGFTTSVQVNGVILEPLNPIALAIALNASFVTRVSTTDEDQMNKILKKAIQHKGYALVDVLHPCVSFNKVNTYQWIKKNTVRLEDTYDPEDRSSAIQRALETDKFSLGIFYIQSGRTTFEANLNVYRDSQEPLFSRSSEPVRLQKFINQL